jgi:hypothetical protein
MMQEKKMNIGKQIGLGIGRQQLKKVMMVTNLTTKTKKNQQKVSLVPKM